MIASSLTAAARLLGGEVVGGQVLCPGPGHSAIEALLFDFLRARHIVSSFTHLLTTARCSAAIAFARGLDGAVDTRKGYDQSARQRVNSGFGEPLRDCRQSNIARAIKIWDEAIDPKGSLVEAYLHGRELPLPKDVAGEAIRFHPRCPWEGGSVPAMIAALRDIHTDEIVGVHRTAPAPTEKGSVARCLAGLPALLSSLIQMMRSIRACSSAKVWRPS
jgi:hypothetical protein